MLPDYFRWTLRCLLANRFTSAVNLLALSLGLVSFMVAVGAALFLRSADLHLPNAARIFAISEEVVDLPSGISTGVIPLTSDPVGVAVAANVPGLAAVTRIRTTHDRGVMVDGMSYFFQVVYVDSRFAQVFQLPLAAGDPSTAFSVPKSAILTEASARQLFGESDAVGKTIVIGGLDITIAGVLKPIVLPSIFAFSPNRFDMLLSSDVGDVLNPALPEPEGWHHISDSTFIRLAEGTDPAKVALRLAALPAGLSPKGSKAIHFGLVPLGRYLEGLLNCEIRSQRTGLSASVLLLAVGVLVLVVASLNYANLAAAQAAVRLRESGMRIVLGASRWQILVQRLVESAVLAAITLVLVLVVLAAVTPLLGRATGIDLSDLLFSRWAFWGLSLCGLAAAIAIGGCYPAMVLSGGKAMRAARGGRVRQGLSRMAAVFVSLQFLAANVLTILLIIMGQQLSILHAAVSPTNGDPLLVVNTPLSTLPFTVADLRRALADVPGIVGVSAVDSEPWSDESRIVVLFTDSADRPHSVESFVNAVADDFFSTMGSVVLAGRTLSSDQGDRQPPSLADETDTYTAVVDRSLAGALGWSPDQAVGKNVHLRTLDGLGGFRIVGVVEDRPQHFLGLGSQGNLYRLAPEATVFPIIRLAHAHSAVAAKSVDAALERLAGQEPTRRRFSADLFADSAGLFHTVLSTLAVLAGFALAIAVLGLVGIAIHVTDGRVQEIGVRKILGAGTANLCALLLWDLSRPVLMAALLSWPIAYLASRDILPLFLQRISVGPFPFIVSLAATLVIAWIAVGWRILSAARRDPADILRYE